jgi:capsular polysaccharide biosynthesis protein
LLPPAVEVPVEATPEVVKAIDKPAIAREAIERLGLDGSMEPGELLDNLVVQQLGSTLFIRLSYRDANPGRVQRIPNAVAKVASEEIRQETPYVYDLRIHVWEDLETRGGEVCTFTCCWWWVAKRAPRETCSPA